MCEHSHLYTDRKTANLATSQMITYKTICLDCMETIDTGYEQVPIIIGKDKK